MRRVMCVRDVRQARDSARVASGCARGARLLVYVADPRQLEVGGPAPQQPPEPTSLGAADAVAAAQFSVDTALHLPFSSENNVFRTHYEQNPHRNNHDTNQVYYKNFQETDGKPEQAYVASENTDHGVEYFSNSQSYPKVQTLRIDDSKISIVNQSINILNQQVGVSRGLGGPSVAPQLVRTVDGVVLAVVPPTLSAPSASSASASEACLPPVLTQSDTSHNIPDPSHTITVPLGWRRIVSGASVLYIRNSKVQSEVIEAMSLISLN
ncbi:hypothetical protein EVAR_35416_1 [Eumeta japonica]|uniref:Uncharacterized protein n=1 Tax=Eumeta variegata TaxID=151549 RepID=A0A4C1XB06_EUMVA|nr:hypothetical protein EVAR_35416_1 [Eumeta japonica]